MANNLFNEQLRYITSDLVNSSRARVLLKLSRYSFDKIIKNGELKAISLGKKTFYSITDLENLKNTPRYRELKNGVVDHRNQLNDLTGKEWLPETVSYFFQKGLGADSDEAKIEKEHPAPFSFQDIKKLILFFTKKGMRVLDPFGGVGSTAKACELTGRICTSIELTNKYHELSKRRLETEVGEGTSFHHQFINGDSCIELRNIENESFDFMVTSPPYWGILHKQDQKVKKERVEKELDTRYSDDTRDLGNIQNYNEFLDILTYNVLLQCARVLRTGKYMAIIVSDFRDKSEYISFHSDIIYRLRNVNVPEGGHLKLQGTKILIQNHKSVLPYGYPFSYVENIHHQYVLIFKKEK